MNEYVTAIIWTATASSGLTTESLQVYQSQDTAATLADAYALALAKFKGTMTTGFTIRATSQLLVEIPV